MKTNDSIEIFKVANGFLVTPSRDPNSYRSHAETHCFNRMPDLVKFLEEHFEVKTK